MRRLRLQLIGILLLVALLPAIPAALTVRALFQRSFAPVVEEQILDGARAGLAGVREILEHEKELFRQRILSGAPLDTLTHEEVAGLDPSEQRALRSLAATAIRDGAAASEAGRHGRPGRVKIRGRDHLAAKTPPAGGESLWLTAPLSPDLVQRAQSLTETVRLVETMRRDRGPVLRGLLATFLAVYGIILALVVILGLLFASRLTRPLQALGEGIGQVAGGDLQTRLETRGRGHLARLLRQFNGMVDQLRDQREELMRLERLAVWRNLARRLAHEIKNPLTPIQLAAQQMRDAYPGESPDYRQLLRDGVEIVEEEVRSLRTLVKEFSEFARLPAPEMRPVRVGDILDDVVALYGEGKARAKLEAVEKELRVLCDPDEIHRVLINLVNNALHAQGEVGREEPVEIAVSRADEGSVAFEVRDRGPGVALRDRRRIFDPDYSTKSEGMGLGLAIVDEIVRAHGGAVEVGDRREGGAAFSFVLPVREPEKRSES